MTAPGTVRLTCARRDCPERVSILWAHLEHVTAADYLCDKHRRTPAADPTQEVPC
jgi:hypothetical protein